MAFKNKDELIQELKQVKTFLQTQWPIESLSLFGSWGRNDARPGSDVDLLIQFESNPTADRIDAWTFVGIQLKLEELLGCKVDLVEKKALKPRLMKVILPEAIEI